VAGSPNHILRIGVTGGIGSGKSTVCRILKQHGIPVISADEIAKEITDSHPPVRKKIIAVLGPQAYDAQGRLNRPYVASRLFGHRRVQRAVDAIVHPHVLREIQRRIRILAKVGQRVVVVEAALIYEARVDRFLDLVVVVDAVHKRTIRRIRKRDGLSAAEVRRRIASQWNNRRKRDKADILIRNDGTIADLRKKVRFLLKMVRLMPKGSLHA